MFFGAEVCSNRLVEIVGVALEFTGARGADEDFWRLALTDLDSEDKANELRRRRLLMEFCKDALVEKALLMAALPALAVPLLPNTLLESDRPDNMVGGGMFDRLLVEKIKREKLDGDCFDWWFIVVKKLSSHLLSKS